MPIAMVFDLPGFTQDHYEQIRGAVAPGNRASDISTGLLYHVAGPTDGGWRVIEVWESQEVADRFFQETLAPAFQQANVQGTQPQVFPVHNTMQP
jgi:quinol monooxygenase YgiN